MNFISELDYSLFHILNSWANKTASFDGVVVFFAHYLIFVLFFCWLIFFLQNYRNKQFKLVALASVFSLVLARLIVTPLIRLFAYRDRPFITLDVTQLILKDVEASFPSGHTVSVVAVGTALYFYNKKLGIVVVVLGVLIGISRIIAGLHFPLDVLAGLILGIFSGIVVQKVLTKKFKF